MSTSLDIFTYAITKEINKTTGVLKLKESKEQQTDPIYACYKFRRVVLDTIKANYKQAKLEDAVPPEPQFYMFCPRELQDKYIALVQAAAEYQTKYRVHGPKVRDTIFYSGPIMVRRANKEHWGDYIRSIEMAKVIWRQRQREIYLRLLTLRKRWGGVRAKPYRADDPVVLGEETPNITRTTYERLTRQHHICGEAMKCAERGATHMRIAIDAGDPPPSAQSVTQGPERLWELALTASERKLFAGIREDYEETIRVAPRSGVSTIMLPDLPEFELERTLQTKRAKSKERSLRYYHSHKKLKRDSVRERMEREAQQELIGLTQPELSTPFVLVSADADKPFNKPSTPFVKPLMMERVAGHQAAPKRTNWSWQDELSNAKGDDE